MSFHYPFGDVDPLRYEAAGFRITSRTRVLAPSQVLESWPPAWVPQVRMTYPRHCLHPDDRLRVTGRGLTGEVFATGGDTMIIELTAVADDIADTGDFAPLNVIELDIGDDTAPLRYVNSSTTAFSRCHLAWIRALVDGWDARLVPAADRPAGADIAARFIAETIGIDGPSAFWEDRAFEIEDLGVSTSATHEWLVGRDGLPDA